MTKLSLKTADQVAAFLAVSRRTVDGYLARGCPGKRGDYPLKEIVAWCRQNVWKPTATEDPRITAAAIQSAQASAAIRAAKAKELLGALVRRDTVQTVLNTLCANIRNELQAIPSKLSAMVPAEQKLDAEIALENEVNRILTNLAESSSKPPLGNSPAAATPPAAKSSKKPKRKAAKR